jgi:hypothetical protein
MENSQQHDKHSNTGYEYQSGHAKHQGHQLDLSRRLNYDSIVKAFCLDYKYQLYIFNTCLY